MKYIKSLAVIAGLLTSLNANMDHMKMGTNLDLNMVNQMKPGMQMKLKYDYTVNLPILMRAVMKNMNNPQLNLNKQQKIDIKQHKINVMDTIGPVMKKSHMLSKKLKDGLFNNTLSRDELYKLSKEVSQLKEQTLSMKITCIRFLQNTLSKEQFQTLLSIDKKMPYLNYPYNY